jgi:hypothetical protein
MIKKLFGIIIFFTTLLSHAAENPIIEIEGFERTTNAIIVWGNVNHIPPGTKMWISVTSINGKPVNEQR